MANDDKTEKPTPKRRTEARKRGQVAKSPDLNGAGVLFAGFIAVTLMSSELVSVHGRPDGRRIFGHIARPGEVASAAGLKGLFDQVLQHGARTTVAPIAAVCVAAAPAAERRPGRGCGPRRAG